MKIEFSEHDSGIIKRTSEQLYKVLSNPENTPEKFEYLDEDASDIFRELGEYLFEEVIGNDKVEEIENLRYPPEPEPEPMPETDKEGESVHYCRQCETPRIFTHYSDWDGVQVLEKGRRTCKTCGKVITLVSPIIEEKESES